MPDLDLQSLLGTPLSDERFLGIFAECDADMDVDVYCDRMYFTSERQGFALNFDLRTTRLASIFYYSGNSDAFNGDDKIFSRYEGVLPDELAFDMTRDDVVRRLGTPTNAGEERVDPDFGPVPAWIRYSLADKSIHIQLDSNNKISLITLIAPKFTP